MNKLIIILSIISSVAYSQSVYYVATDGSDANPGTLSQPFATFQAGIDATTTAGDTVYFRGGTYYSQSGNSINPESSRGVSGTYGNPVVYSSYPGEWAVFDCSAHCGNGASYNSFLSFSYAEHIHIKNIEIKNLFQCQAVNTGAIAATYSRNLEFHHLIIHDISSPRGFWMQGGAWATHYEDPNFNVPIPHWGDVAAGGNIDTTRFINIDVYNTCDTLGGGNAGDAWKGIWYGDNYVEWINCRAWNYSDDGLDPNNIDGATFVVENSFFMPTEKYERFNIEGNGGKFTTLFRNNSTNNDSHHFLQMRNTLVANTINFGIQDNLFQGGTFQLNSLFENNITYKTRYAYNPKATTTYKNNIAYQNDNTEWVSGSPQGLGSNNSFAITDYTDSISITYWDFLSVDLGEISKDRNSDGSLPEMNLFKLRGTSRLVDAGTADLSEPKDSSGTTALAPDIGMWEYVPTVGTDKNILSFTFENQSGYSTYDEVNHTVHATIYYSNSNELSTLEPIVLPSDGDTISPGFLTIVDFSTQPVTYDVFPIDNPTDIQEWSITIDTAVASPYANVRSASQGSFFTDVDTVNNLIGMYYPVGTDVSSLSPSITLDRGATSNYSSLVPHDFSTDLDFTVTAEDGTVKNWTMAMSPISITDNGDILGFDIVFSTSRTDDQTAYSPFDVTIDGEIESISIYHEGGTGNILVGIYDTDPEAGGVSGGGEPLNRLAVSNPTAISENEGFQTIPLTSPLSVSSGDRIWLAYVFEDNPGYRVLGERYGAPEMTRVDNFGYSYVNGLADPARPTGGWNFFASVYCNYGDGSPPASIRRPKPGRSAGGTSVLNGKVLIF